MTNTQEQSTKAKKKKKKKKKSGLVRFSIWYGVFLKRHETHTELQLSAYLYG